MYKTEIRVLSEIDVEDFWQVRLRALREEPESFGADYEERSKTPIGEVTRQLQCTGSSFVLGAFVPELVGIVGFYRQEGSKVRHKGTIWGMYVAPEFRCNGIGRALMKSAIERVSAMLEVEQLHLAVVTTKEAAHNLYLSLGFKSYGKELKALKIGDRYFDEELMQLDLIAGR